MTGDISGLGDRLLLPERIVLVSTEDVEIILTMLSFRSDDYIYTDLSFLRSLLYGLPLFSPIVNVLSMLITCSGWPFRFTFSLSDIQIGADGGSITLSSTQSSSYNFLSSGSWSCRHIIDYLN